MSRQNLNVDGEIGAMKGKVRKRRCSSSSSSSLAQNYLKRAILVRRRVGSTTPVPMWKTMSSEFQSLQNNQTLNYLARKNGGNAKESPISARKLAAALWEIDGLPSPGEDRRARKKRIIDSSKLSSIKLGLSDPCNISERMDPLKMYSRGRTSAGSKQLVPRRNHNPTPYRLMIGLKNHLKDVYVGVATSRELVKVLSRTWDLERVDCTNSSLVSSLKIELDRACNHVDKLIQGQKTKCKTVNLSKRFGGEKVVSKIKGKGSIHSDLTSMELGRKTRRLNKKLGAELAETKASLTRAKKELEREKKARRQVEQVCNELARAIGEVKRQYVEVCNEVEEERKMFQLADVLREERVQMKLSEAKYLFEEKNALVDKLRNELEAHLKSKTGEEQRGGSLSCEKTKVELPKNLRETFPGLHQNKDKHKEDNRAVNNNDEGEIRSIELNVDELSNSFQWGDALKNGSKNNLVDRRGGNALQRKLKTLPFP